MEATKVGVREFRENLSSYLESKTPVAITRNGSTIGVYTPAKPRLSLAKPHPSKEQLDAMLVAGEKLDAMIRAAGTSEEELMEDFKRLRREEREERMKKKS